MTILFVIPTSALLSGVPLNSPVDVLNSAQLGLLVIEKVRLSPTSISAPTGAKLYASSSATTVPGVPIIVGASLILATVIMKDCVTAEFIESVTETLTEC